MKAKVTLTYSVTVFVEADNEEQIYDWMNCTTPKEALEQCRDDMYIEQDYSEELECFVRDDSEVNIKL